MISKGPWHLFDILLMEPDDETAYTGLARSIWCRGRYKMANEAFQNALNINGNNEVALAGIRKIMDPDGSKHDEQARGRDRALHPSSAPLAASMAPQAGMEKRQTAVKSKKLRLSETARQAEAVPVQIKKRASARLEDWAVKRSARRWRFAGVSTSAGERHDRPGHQKLDPGVPEKLRHHSQRRITSATWRSSPNTSRSRLLFPHRFPPGFLSSKRSLSASSTSPGILARCRRLLSNDA